MSASKKDKELWKDVTNPIYFYNVLAQMIEIDPEAPLNESLRIRFGLEGEHEMPDQHAPTGDHRYGARPNYQVELDGHPPRPIRSNANKPYAHKQASVAAWDEEHLSDRRFTFKEIVELLKSCIERAPPHR
jgi:hypothetical protein